jgi:hypothetical protein
MAFDTDSLRRAQVGVQTDASIDAGLRSYMLSVYNYMASGVALTGIMSMLVFINPSLANMIFNISADGYITGYTGLGWVVILSPLAFVFGMSLGVNKMSASTLQIVFWAFCAMMGLSLSSVLFMYTGVSVAKVFFITAGTFGALSLYGYTTKKDLTGWGSFLMMGLFGLIIASVVNWFLQSSIMDFVISLIGVGLFAALTAYDTQMIKNMYYAADGSETRTKKAVMGALRLYLDFINLFIMLLRLLGNRN